MNPQPKSEEKQARDADDNHAFHERLRCRQQQAEVLPRHDCPECGVGINPPDPHCWNGKALVHHGCFEIEVAASIEFDSRQRPSERR